MNLLNLLRSLVVSVEQSRQLLAEIREGVANLTDVVNRRLPPNDVDQSRPAGPSVDAAEPRIVLSQSQRSAAAKRPPPSLLG